MCFIKLVNMFLIFDFGVLRHCLAQLSHSFDSANNLLVCMHAKQCDML